MSNFFRLVKLFSYQLNFYPTNQKSWLPPVAVTTLSFFSAQGSVSGSESLQHVATLFFGGPDDREALGFSRRLSMHHHINLTIIRFLAAADRDRNVGLNVAHNKEEDDDVLMMSVCSSDRETESEADTAILTEFYNRYANG